MRAAGASATTARSTATAIGRRPGPLRSRPSESRITLTGEAMPSAVSCVGTTISGSSASAQADLATSIVLPPPTATTASASRRAGAAAMRATSDSVFVSTPSGVARPRGAAPRDRSRASGAVNVVPLTTARRSKSRPSASSSSARDQLLLPADGAQVARQLHVAPPDREPVAARCRLGRAVGPHATRASTSSRACARSSWSSISIQARPSTGTRPTGTAAASSWIASS